MRHSDDKWQRLKYKASSQTSHFVPFYHKENASVLDEKKDNPITFPNYMNWYNQNDPKSGGRQVPSKQSPSKGTDSKKAYQANYYSNPNQEHPYTPSYRHLNQEGQPSVEEFSTAQNQVFQSTGVDNQRQEKLNKLRQEIKEYQDYQFRRPFQPNDLPSTWKDNYREEDKHSRTKRRKTFYFEETSPQAENQASTMANSRIVPKRGHLNRGLQSIMADEPDIRFEKSSDHQSGHFSYFPNKENKQAAPYLNHQQHQSNDGNGDSK